MAVITIIGIGQIGSALAFVAAENGNEVRLVGTASALWVLPWIKRL